MTQSLLASKRKTNGKESWNKYSAVKFRQYFRRLKADCEANADANKVMNGIDPISRFLTRKRAIRSELTAEEKPSKEQIFQDPKFHCTKFISTLEERLEQSLAAEDALKEYEKIKQRLVSTTIEDAADNATEEQRREIADLQNARTISLQHAEKQIKVAQEAVNRTTTSKTGEGVVVGPPPSSLVLGVPIVE